MATEFPLSLVIKAVDKATAPLRAINARLKAFMAPVRSLNNSVVALGQEAGITRLAHDFAAVGGAVRSVIKEVRHLGLEIAAVVGAAALGAFAIVKSASDEGDHMAKTARRVGLAVDAYAQLQYAAQAAGIGQDTFNASMDTFNKNLGMARGNRGKLYEFLSAVSPALLQQVKGAKTSEQALGMMFRAMDRLKDPAKRAAFAGVAFGADEMANIVEKGTGEIQRMRDEFVRIAGPQEKFAQGAEDFNDAWSNVVVSFKAVRNAILGELFPVLADLAKQLTKLIVGHREEIREWAVEFARELPGRLRALVAWFRDLGNGIKKFMRDAEPIVGMLGGIKGVLIAVAVVIAAPLLSALASLTAAVFTLGAALLTTPVGWIILALAAMGAAAIALYNNWDKISAAFGGLIDRIGNAFKSMWDEVKPIVDAIMDVFRLGPVGAALKFGGIVGDWMKQTYAAGDGSEGPTFADRPTFGADAARPTLRTGWQRQLAEVTVNFENTPRGTRIESGGRPSTPINLNLGYSMLEAN